MAEKSANNVSAYGGLGAHGLEFGNDTTGETISKEILGSFSGSAAIYAPKFKK